MDKVELKRIAEAHGLKKLADKHLEQLAVSIKSNSDIARRLPKDLHWTEECAHVYRFPGVKEEGGR